MDRHGAAGEGTSARRGAAARARRGLAQAVRRVSAGALLLALGGCAAIYDARYNLANPWQDEGPPIPDYAIDSGLHWRPAGWLDDARLVLAEPPGNPQRLAIWRPFEDPSGQALEPVALKAPVGELASFWRLRCLRDGWVRYPAGKAPDPQSGQRLHQDWWGRVDGAHRLVVPYREVEGVPDPLVANRFTCGIERIPMERMPAGLPESWRLYEPLLPGDGYYLNYDLAFRIKGLKIVTEEMRLLSLPRDGTRLSYALKLDHETWSQRYVISYSVAGLVNPSLGLECEIIHTYVPATGATREECLPDENGKSPWRRVRDGYVAILDRSGYRTAGGQYKSGLIFTDAAGNVRKILSGHIRNFNNLGQSDLLSVSPNGCQVAFHHSPTTGYVERRLEAEPNWRRDDTAKVIDLCAASEAIEAAPSIELEYTPW